MPRRPALHRPDTSERKHYIPVRHVEAPLHPRLLYAGALERSASWMETPHSHHFVEVIFVNSGRGLVKTAGPEGETARRVGAGDVVIYNAGVPHNEISSADDPLMLMFFGARNISLAGLPENALAPGETALLRSGDAEAALRFYFTSLVEESRSKGRFSREVSESLTRIILALLLRLMARERVREPPVHPAYVTAKTYIDAHFVELRSVEELCRKIHVTRYYLTHLFQRCGDKPPLQCLTRRKIDRARELLATSDLPMAEVASRSGFGSETYFFRVFKAYTSVPPGRYRKERQGNGCEGAGASGG